MTALAVVTFIGALLFAFPIATYMTQKTQGVERLTGNLEPAFEPEALQQKRSDMEIVQAMSDELQPRRCLPFPVRSERRRQTFRRTCRPSSPTSLRASTNLKPLFLNSIR